VTCKCDEIQLWPLHFYFKEYLFHVFKFVLDCLALKMKALTYFRMSETALPPTQWHTLNTWIYWKLCRSF